MNSIPICSCGHPLTFYVSCCKDPECCGMADSIECDNCNKNLYFWDRDEFVEKWIELGGKKEDLE